MAADKFRFVESSSRGDLGGAVGEGTREDAEGVDNIIPFGSNGGFDEEVGCHAFVGDDLAIAEFDRILAYAKFLAVGECEFVVVRAWPAVGEPTR